MSTQGDNWIAKFGARFGRYVLVMLCSLSCNGDELVQSGPEITSLGITGGPKTDTVCARLGWNTCPIWEVTDDQALNNGSGGYGPLTHIIPSPELGTLTSIAEWTAKGPNGVLAALVIVDTTESGARPVAAPPPGALPATYTALGLQKGHNCLYISHASGQPADAGWVAYVTPISTGEHPCPPTYPLPSAISVTSFQHPLFTDADDYPMVARFHEGQRGTQAWVPQMGLKCANRWCVVTGNSTLVTPPQVAAATAVAGSDASRPWLVPGWHDVQHIGDSPSAVSAFPTPRFGIPGFHASFIPHPALGDYNDATFRGGPWVHVGTVWMANAPAVTSKYHTIWKLKAGSNEMYLRRDTSGTWRGLLIAGLDSVRLAVEQEVHERFQIPGVVRFRWSFTDEEGWVRCDVGCCKVGPES